MGLARPLRELVRLRGAAIQWGFSSPPPLACPVRPRAADAHLPLAPETHHNLRLGRAAMLGFAGMALTELITGVNTLQAWHLQSVPFSG